MQPYGVNQLRKMFLEFFESKGHLAMKSFSEQIKKDSFPLKENRLWFFTSHIHFSMLKQKCQIYLFLYSFKR